MAGVLFGRPYAYRDHILIWPYTFFLFTWSAAAYGPSFTLFITWLTEKIAGKKLVKDNVVYLLAKISGWMIITYIIAKSADQLWWMFKTAPSEGFKWTFFYENNPFYGHWIWVAEIIIGGFVPGLILIVKPARENNFLRVTATLLAIMGVCLNRWVMVLQTMAVPVMSFDTWAMYIPSWQEVATTILPVAYGVILIMISYRYLPIFPQERELNPIEPAVSQEDAAPAAGEALEPAKA